MTPSQKVAKILLSINAISLNPKKPFKYVSGILSPIYVDNRILMSYPKQRKQIRDLYLEAIKKTTNNFGLIAGTATAGIPHAAWIADKLDLPMVYVRGSAKDHGKGNQIEGIVKKGQETVVIEDLISTGESSITTANALRGAAAKVSHVFSIFTFGMKKADENFKKNKLKLIPLATLSDVVSVAEKNGAITNKEKTTILDWAQDPPAWGKKMGFE